VGVLQTATLMMQGLRVLARRLAGDIENLAVDDVFDATPPFIGGRRLKTIGPRRRGQRQDAELILG